MSRGKQAVAFVLDASPSMNAPYPSESKSPSKSNPGSTTTRFSCAVSAIEDMISNLIIQSVENEVIVVVVNAPGGGAADATRHHLCCDEQVRDGTAPFPGIVSLNGIDGDGDGDDDDDGDRGMTRPNVSLLRRLHRLEIDATDMEEEGEDDLEDDDGSDVPSSGSETENGDDVEDGSSPPRRKRARGTNNNRRRRRSTRPLANFCDGIVVAADAVHRRTSGKKFVRRIVLFTDATNEISIHPGHVQTVVDGLVRLRCTLDVIGLDFDDDAEAVFELPASQVDDAKKPDVDVSEATSGSGDGEESSSDREDGDGGSGGESGEEDDDDDEDDEDDEEEPDPERVKSENEKFLISLARLTGGSVTAASTLRQVLRKTSGRRTPKSTRKKMLLAIAPDLEVEARYSLLMSRANPPTPGKAVVLIDERNEPLRDGMGEERTSGIRSHITHWDADDADREVEIHERTDAYRYGSDLIPMGGFDVEGLKMRSPVRMTILGYAPRRDVPRSLFVGTPYAVTGEGKSSRSCEAVSALARALDDLDQVAVCSFVKMKDADPIMGALFPLTLPTEGGTKREEGGGDGKDGPHPEAKPSASTTTTTTRALFFVQMPFADDVSRITMRPLDDDDDRQGADAGAGAGADSSSLRNEVADGLVDSLMLPDDVLRSDEVPNPSLRCTYRTLVRRAVDGAGGGGGGVVEVRRPCGRRRRFSTDDSGAMNAVGEDDDDDAKEEEDPMSTPGWVVERARGCIERFKETFPVVKERHQRGDGRGGGVKKKKKRKYWSDIV